MRVAFSVGKNSSALIENISKHYDNIEFYTYSNVKDLIRESNLRHIYFDRIIYSEKVFRNPEEDLRELNEYIINSSDSTTIVLITERKNTLASQIFQEIFNSPLYTVAVLKKATVLILCEVVGKDILEVKTKYFDMVEEEVASEPAKEASPEKPKSRFGMFGGKSPKTTDSKNESEESNNIPQSATQNKRGCYQEISSLNTGNSNGNRGQTSGPSVHYDREEDDSSVFSEGTPVSPHVENRNEDFSSPYSDDDFLGLGKYGSTHSDTGFLGEEELDELENEENSSSSPDNQKNDNYGSGKNSKSQKNESGAGRNNSSNEDADYDKSENRFSDLEIRNLSKLVLVTGERGVGVTTYIADLTYELYNRGESVLIVDCDYKRNGILSFIDARDFYQKGHEDGIDSLNPYVDEECDIISNGYGSLISKSSIINLVTDKRVQSNYDRILIDCPLDCINAISERVVRGNTVLVLTKGDRVSLVATSIGLLDKSVIESSLERYIMANATVAISSYTDYLKEDIDYVKDTILFPNGCWLDNVGR